MSRYFDRDAQPEVHPDEWDESHNNYAEPEDDEVPETDAVEEDYGGVLGADGQIHSDADPGL
jgi:hypothetical protein